MKHSALQRVSAGFTMVEILIVMLIIGIVAAIIAEAFLMTQRTTVSMNRRSSVAFSLQEGADKLVDELRRASAINDASTDYIEVTLVDRITNTSEIVTYAFDAANNRITRNGEAVVGDVTGLAFTFYDIDGVETDVISDIKSFKMVLDGSVGTEPWQLNTQVSFRKLHPGAVT